MMKKLLVFLLICLSSTVTFAANEHFSADRTGCDPFATKLNGYLYINGEEQFNINYEIIAYDQDGIIRAAKRPVLNPRTGRYYYQIQLWGVTNYTVYTFYVYDNESETMLDVTEDFGETISYIGNNPYPYNGVNSGSTNPYPINFISAAQTPEFALPIEGYGTGTNHWYLISSPIGSVAPGDVENLVKFSPGNPDEDYDLFYFSQAGDGEGNEWINHKVTVFNLIDPGKGYLYASKQSDTIIFRGVPFEGTETTIPLDEYVAGEAASPNNWAGWNLIGNPFTVDAYIDRPFYRMNGDGSNIMTDLEDGPIALMEGVFIVAESNEQNLNITTQASKKVSRLALNLSNGRNIIDRAIVRFGEGNQLPKVSLDENSTKVYIPMDDQDYAVVRSEGVGEMPVNFKAESNGTYTFSFNAEEVSFGYLHLIDNMTGNDVDLLANPSYSFEARTTDYASRFRLVFATGNADDTFAFYSNGSFVINNEGNATLQVIDVTGRTLSAESINGCANVNFDAAPGVYMIRLVNGDNVKVQKVVVR